MENVIINFAKAHVKLWTILSVNPDWSKEKVLWEYGIGLGTIRNNCFACETLIYKTEGINYSCKYCPLKWPNNSICCHTDNIFNIWDYTHDPVIKRFRAIEIANLEWVGRKKFPVLINNEFIKFWRD